MKLVTFEFRMGHIKGPEHDWWVTSDARVPEDALERTLARMESSDRYRNIQVQDDPHDGHSADDIESSTSGMSSRCTVPGCTWSWDYD